MKYKSTLIGDKFGMLTVINLSNQSKTKSITGRIWKCKCDCGNECDVDTGKLTSKNTRSCGCLKTPNLIGKRFGKLVVIKDDGIRKSNVVWLCECDCGGTKIATTYHLKSKSVRSCGCLRSGNLRCGVRNLGKGIAVRNLIVKSYKENAKRNKREFDLNIEQLEFLFSGNCYYCGDAPVRTRFNKRTGDSYTYNGIDRKDNSIGYTLENSVSCCTECNLKKGSSSSKEFLDWVKKISLNHFKK